MHSIGLQDLRTGQALYLRRCELLLVGLYFAGIREVVLVLLKPSGSTHMGSFEETRIKVCCDVVHNKKHQVIPDKTVNLKD